MAKYTFYTKIAHLEPQIVVGNDDLLQSWPEDNHKLADIYIRAKLMSK